MWGHADFKVLTMVWVAEKVAHSHAQTEMNARSNSHAHTYTLLRCADDL